MGYYKSYQGFVRFSSRHGEIQEEILSGRIMIINLSSHLRVVRTDQWGWGLDYKQ